MAARGTPTVEIGVAVNFCICCAVCVRADMLPPPLVPRTETLPPKGGQTIFFLIIWRAGQDKGLGKAGLDERNGVESNSFIMRALPL